MPSLMPLLNTYLPYLPSHRPSFPRCPPPSLQESHALFGVFCLGQIHTIVCFLCRVFARSTGELGNLHPLLRRRHTGGRRYRHPGRLPARHHDALVEIVESHGHIIEEHNRAC